MSEATNVERPANEQMAVGQIELALTEAGFSREQIAWYRENAHRVIEADRRAEQEAGWRDAWIFRDDLAHIEDGGVLFDSPDEPSAPRTGLVRIRIPDSKEPNDG